MVKQYVARYDSRWTRWLVFRTGDDRWYLFCAVDANLSDTGVHVPVRRSDLVPEARRALAHGCGRTIHHP